MGTENDLPGISLKDEQRQLQNIIGIAQDNLDRAKKSVKAFTSGYVSASSAISGFTSSSVLPLR